MNVYLGGSYRARGLLVNDAAVLEDRGGVTVTSRWLDPAHDCLEQLFQGVVGEGAEYRYQHLAGIFAGMAFEDIRSSDVAVFYIGKESTSGGFHAEAGYGLGKEIPVLCYGEVGLRIPTFFCHPSIERHGSVWAVADRLKQKGPAQRPRERRFGYV